MKIADRQKFRDWMSSLYQKEFTHTTQINDLPKPKLTTLEFLKKLTGKDFTICPCCGVGHLNRASPKHVIA
ncbi:hypothetical protein [Paradesulfitobacterium aromaticivorans]